MVKMRVVDVVVFVFEKEGIQIVFGVLGVVINLFYLVMCKLGGISYVLVCYVEGVLYMVEGFMCVVLGNIGVCIGMLGFVGIDMIIGFYFVFVDLILIFVIIGQVLCVCFYKEDFQVVDIELIVKLVMKWVVIVCELVFVLWVFQQVFYLMCLGCLGLVLVDLLIDVQFVEIEFDIDMYELLLVYKFVVICVQIEKVFMMFNDVDKLLIVLGGGVFNVVVEDLFVQFVEMVGVLVILMLMLWGVIVDDYLLMVGMVGLQMLYCYGNVMMFVLDFVFGIGNCWVNCYMGSVEVYMKGCKFVYVDIELMQIGCVFGLDFGIVFDVKVVFELFVVVVQEWKVVGKLKDCSVWVVDCQECKCMLQCKMYFDNVLVKLQCVYEEMNKVFGCDICYVSMIGLLQIVVVQFLYVFKVCNWINCGQVGLFGWMIFVVFGVCVVDLSCLIVVLFGDYDFQFMIEELVVGV